MPRVTRNTLGKFASKARRKRTGVLTKAKYKPRTAAANRSLIKGNALAIRTLKRLMPPSVFTDWQYSGVQTTFTASAPDPYFTIDVVKLMEPNVWNSVLRTDANVIESSQTLIKRMQMNLRYSLGESDWCQITTFIVSIRRDAANKPITFSDLKAGEDYIYSGSQQQFNPRLNPAVFKVHYCRNVSLMSNAWLAPRAVIGDAAIVGNPDTTLKKGQVNLKLNYRIRQPLGTPWRQMTQDQFAPSQRLYLISFFRGQTNDVDDLAPRVDFDNLVTCFNSS